MEQRTPSGDTPGEESLAGKPAQPTRKLRRWVWGLAIAVTLLAGGGYAAVRLLAANNPTSTTSHGPVQPTVTGREQSQIGNGPVATLSTQLDVSALTAQNADLLTLLAKALQVSGSATIQGNVTVNGNGTFGGALQAANFSGSGAGLTGVDAALLNGKPGSYYSNLAGNVAGAAQLGSPNTFTSANNFAAGLTSAGITDTGALTVNGAANLSGSTTVASLILSTPLTVPNGGTGLTTVPAASVMYGQGGPALGVATAPSAGLCLLSGAADVQWGSCSGAIPGVATLDNLSGLLSIANSTGAGTTITIDNASTVAKGIASFNATNFSVVTGAVNTIQNIAVTAAPTFAGLTLTSALTVANGGTGAANLGANGVLLGNGAGAITSLVAGGAGNCLVSTAGAPIWTSCPGAGGVSTLDTLTGGLIIANSTGLGSTITINNAKADGATKGIATFNAANFSDNGAGVVNTIQNIATSSTPTFAGLNTNTVTPSAAFTLGAAAQQFLLQGTNASTIVASNGTNTTTLAFSNPTANVIYQLQAAAAGTYQICTSAGNCLGGAGGANTALSNLASVALNTSLLPGSAGAVNLGSAALPFGTLFVAGTSGSPATNNFQFTGVATAARTITIPDASGTICLTTGNCVGTGGAGAAIGGSGTLNQLAKFTASGTIGDSSISDDGSSVTVKTASSATAFQVQNATGTISLFTVDTSGSNVNLGTAGGNVHLTVSGTTDVGNTNSLGAFAVKNAGGNTEFNVNTVDNNTYLTPSTNANLGNTANNSNGLVFQSNYWNGSSSVANNYTIKNVASTSAPNYALDFQNNGGATVASLSGDSGAALFQNAANSTSAFQIQNAAGTQSLFNIDTSNSATTIGTSPAVFGYAGPATNYNSGGGQNAMQAMKITTASGGTLKYINIYLHNPDSPPDNKFQVALYADGPACGTLTSCPGALITSSASQAITSGDGWYEVPLSANLSPVSSYWIAYNNNGSTPNVNVTMYQTGTGGNYALLDPNTYGTWPGSFGTPTFTANSHSVDMYASVVTGSDSAALSTDSNGHVAAGGGVTSQSYALAVNSAGTGDGGLSVIGSQIINSVNHYALSVGNGTNMFDVDSVNNDVLIGSIDPAWGGAFTSGELDVRGGGGNILNLLDSSGTPVVEIASSGGADGGQVLFQNSVDQANAFQVKNAAGNQIFNIDNVGDKVTLGNITSTGGAGLAGNLALADGTSDNFGVTLNTSTLTGNATISLPNTAGVNDTVCLHTLANCSGGGGGVSGSGTANKIAKFTGSGTSVGDSSITDTGSSVTVQPGSDSTTAFQVKNAGSTTTLLNVDTTSSGAVAVGSAGGAAATTLQGGTGGIGILTGSGAGTTGAINISTGNSSGGNSGNITIDNGTNVPSGTQIADYTFESSTENFGNYINVSVAQSTAQAHGGTHSLAATEQGTGLWATNQPGFTGVTTTPGHVYQISAWLRANTVAEAISGQVQWWNGAAGTTTWTTATDNTTGWTQITGNVVAPALNPGQSSEQMDVQFAATNGANGRIQYIDDVTVTDLSSITEPSVNVGTANAQAVNIGNYNQAGLTSILGGAAGINLLALTNATINVGTDNVNNVTLGNDQGGQLTLQGRGVTQVVNDVDLIQSTTDSASAFTVQNSTGASLLTADTQNTAIVLGNDGTPTALTVRGGAASGTNANGGNITFDASNGTGAAGSGAFIFRTAKPGGNAIGLDNTGHMSGGNPANATLSFTTGAQPNRLLVVTDITATSDSYTSVTYNGVNLTQLSTVTSASGPHVEMWYMVNPPSGTHNIVATLSNNCCGRLIGASTFYNVDQTTPFGTVATASGTGAHSGLNVATTSTAQLVIDGLGSDGADPVNYFGGQTELWNQPPNGGDWPAAGAYQPGNGGTVNMTWDVGGADWADIGVPINPTANSTTDDLTDVLHIANTGNIGINNSSPTHTLDVGGDASFQNASDSTNAFQIQNAAGTSNLLVADTTDNRIGIGTAAPSQELEVANGNAQVTNGNLNVNYGDIDVTGIAPPNTSVTATPTGTGVLNGTYYYYVSFVTASGETLTDHGGGGGTVVNPVNQQVNLTNIPVGPAGVVARRLYRTPANSAWPNTGENLAQISDNTTTTYLDNAPDTSLWGSEPVYNNTSYISNPQGVSHSEAFGLDATLGGCGQETAIGYEAVASWCDTVALGAAASATNSGASALGMEATANFNGTAVGSNTSAGQKAVALGTYATANDLSIAIGHGATTTGNNQLVIGSSLDGAYVQDAYIGDGVTDPSPQNFTLHATGSSTTGVNGANLTLEGGAATTGDANGGNAVLEGGVASGTGTSGSVTVGTQNNTGTTGDITLKTGDSSTGTSGNINIDAGANVPSGTLEETKDFETGTDDMGCWFTCTSTVQSSAQHHGGSNSLAATENGGGSWGIQEDYPGDITVTPGHVYKLSAWVKAGSVVENIGAHAYWPGSLVGGGPDFATGNDSTSAWTQYSGTLVAPAGATNLYFAFDGSGNGTSAVTYFDDFTVTDLTSTNTPAINIGTSNAQAINIGNSSQTTATTIQGGAGGLNLLAGAGADVNVGTSGGNNVNIGSVGSSTTESNVNIATATGNAQLVQVGSGGFESATTIQAGTGGVSVTTGNAATGNSGAILIQSGDAASGTSGNVIIDTGASAVAAGSNLEHDTFETGTDNWISYWDTNIPAQSTTFAEAGTNSLTFTTSAADWAVVGPYPGGTVTPGNTYHFSTWIRGTASGTLDFFADFTTSGADINQLIDTHSGGTSSGWTELSGDVTAPAGSDTVYLHIHGYGGASSDTVYMDEVTVDGSAAAPLISIGGNNAASVVIGNTNALGGTTIQGGADGVALSAGTGDNINIGTENDNIITLGNATGTEPLKLQGTGITNTLTGSGTNPSDIIQTTTNSTSAFQVQNASGNSLFNVDTANSQITAGTSSTTTFGNTFNVSTAPLGGYTSGYYWDGGSGKQALVAQQFTTAGGGPITSLSTYVGTNGVSSTNKLYQMAIYADDGTGNAPGSYIASTAVGTLNSSAAWNTLPISATLAPRTSYWLVYWTNVNDITNNGQDYTYPSNRGSANNQMFGTYDNWQCSSGCGASTNGLPNTYPTAGAQTQYAAVASIYATFANAQPALQIDSAGDSIQSGNALFQAQTDSHSALQVNNSYNTPVLQVDTIYNGVGVNATPDGNFNLTVGAGGNGNGGGEAIEGYSYQLLDILGAGGYPMLNVDSINETVTSADLTIGDPVDNLNGPGLLVSDNFESGNLSLWSGGGSGDISLDTSTAHSGRYSAEVNTSSSTGYARTNFSSSSDTLTLNAYVEWHTLPGSGLVPLLTLYQASTPTNKVELYVDGSNDCLGVINGTTDLGEDGDCGSGWDSWTPIAVTINRTTGEITINGFGGPLYAPDSDYTGLTIGSGWDTLQMGTSTSTTAQYRFDDIVLSTGLVPSESNGLTVQDSLHTGGSASFGGQVLVQPGSDSSTAFQVQDSSGSSVLSVDTANQQTIARQNSSSTTAPALSVQQAGSGDSTIELQPANSANSFYLSNDASDSNSLVINSKSSATYTGTSTPAYVQSHSAGSSTSNTSIADTYTTANNTAGNLIVALVTWDDSSTDAVTCTDDNGDTFATALVKIDAAHGQDTAVCYAANIHGGTKATVTATFGATAAFRGLAISEYSGIAASNTLAYDVSASNTATATTSTDGVTSSAATTTQNGDLIFGGMQDDQAGGTLTAGTGFTARVNTNAGGDTFATEDMVQSMAGSKAATFTTTISHEDTAWMVAFKPSNTSGSFTDTNTNGLFKLSQLGALTLKNTVDSSAAFQVQNSAGTPLFTADTSNMTVTVQSLVVSANLTVNGHIIGGGSTPGIAAGTAACTSPTVSIAGTDTSGLITVTTGSGCAASGKLATITFSNAFGAAPRVTLTPGGANAAGLITYIDSATISTTAFDLDTTATPAGATTYKWYYQVIQ